MNINLLQAKKCKRGRLQHEKSKRGRLLHKRKNCEANAASVLAC